MSGFPGVFTILAPHIWWGMSLPNIQRTPLHTIGFGVLFFFSVFDWWILRAICWRIKSNLSYSYFPKRMSILVKHMKARSCACCREMQKSICICHFLTAFGSSKKGRRMPRSPESLNSKNCPPPLTKVYFPATNKTIIWKPVYFLFPHYSSSYF